MPILTYRDARHVLGVTGPLDHPRQGKHLVEQVRKLPFVELLAGEGHVSEEELPDFYQRLDYVLRNYKRYGDVIHSINSTRALSPETEQKLKQGIEEFKTRFAASN